MHAEVAIVWTLVQHKAMLSMGMGSFNMASILLTESDDVLDGTSEDDTFIGEMGSNDTLHGFGGADRFELSYPLSASYPIPYPQTEAIGGLIDGGDGIDTFVTSANQYVCFDDIIFQNVEILEVGTAWVSASVSQLNSFTSITGAVARACLEAQGPGGTIDFSMKLAPTVSIYFNAVYVTSGVNVSATDNADILAGSQYADRLSGGAGNDLLNGMHTLPYVMDYVGEGGSDILLGGSGNDAYYADLTDTLIETLNGAAGGIDTVYSYDSIDLAQSARIQGQFENAELLQGGFAPPSNENLSGNNLNNRLVGTYGNNILNGRAGADQLVGNTGNDTYIVDNAGDTIYDDPNSSDSFYCIDTVRSSISFNLANEAQVKGDIEDLILTGIGAISGLGNDLDNRLIGNAGDNQLSGQAGRDVINGGAGDDVIQGGDGMDVITGGAGSDIFVFDTVPDANRDRIVDFSVVDDTIRLDDAVFAALGPIGGLNASAFASNAAGVAQDATDRIIYDTDDGWLAYDANGSGAGGRVIFARLQAGLLLTNADFVVS